MKTYKKQFFKIGLLINENRTHGSFVSATDLNSLTDVQESIGFLAYNPFYPTNFFPTKNSPVRVRRLPGNFS